MLGMSNGVCKLNPPHDIEVEFISSPKPLCMGVSCLVSTFVRMIFDSKKVIEIFFCLQHVGFTV
jgi:hypothetical protein